MRIAQYLNFTAALGQINKLQLNDKKSILLLSATNIVVRFSGEIIIVTQPLVTSIIFYEYKKFT